MPTPTPSPAQPPTMTVKVTLGYVRGCAPCEAIARDLAASAITDPSVTGFAALPGRRHACGQPEAAALPANASTGQQTRAAAVAAGQQELPMSGSASTLPNGLDA